LTFVQDCELLTEGYLYILIVKETELGFKLIIAP